MRPYTAILIIPTGIGAAIGGYAGDALPVAKAMSQVVDRLITHPNVMNGAMLYWNIPNSLYVEGYGLDKFAAGEWGLHPVHQNKIGVILDQGIEPELRLRQLQAIDAVRATLGLMVQDYVITDSPLNVELRIAASGTSWGTIGNPDSLLRAADTLINQAGANAIAVIARFPDEVDEETDRNYRMGCGVDAIAGAEAVISHLIVREFQIPCAHAPAFLPPPLDSHLSPRSAAEEIGYTFIPSVLVGLHRAPQLIVSGGDIYPTLNDIWANQVDAVIVPASACGSSAVLSLSQQQCLVVAIEENQTQLQVPPQPLGVKSLQVNSYLEAIGVIAAHKAGINPSAMRSFNTSLNLLSY
ncbi:DUF3326 domain-containing protein [Calothrix sp. UHCC 0171]|uniref:DUF3326 domain-containing protein n=1 Tax=Calothrix sp. UHCC 0171 TaxID=3110245 RepID=UPI002B1FB5AF|nr:DUF3326 domain-containing protein [Calothrix sp. UHCC 0171]MEA5572239.1 DUF3326 domain-containing protein [Calothrix sp. UHCC 0171]